MLETLNSLFTHTQSLATLLAASGAITVGVLGFFSQRRLHQREYTLGVLGHSLTNGRIMNGKNLVRRLAHGENVIDEESISQEELDQLVDLLNYYEFISNAFFQGQLDRKTVIDQMAGSFLITYDCCRGYIESRRKHRGRPKTYIGIQKMAEHIRRNRL